MKELFKSFLLISLTVSAIILTGAVFMTEPEAESPTELPQELEKIDILKMIRPQNYVFSFGDLFIKIYDDEYTPEGSYNSVQIRQQYEEVLRKFIELSMTPTDDVYKLQVEPISESLWRDLKTRRYIKADYPVDIPFDSLLKMYNDYDDVVSESDYRISSIIMLVNTKDVIYFYDAKNEAYFKLYGVSPDVWIDEVYNEVDERKSTKDYYKPIEERYALLKTGLKKYDLLDENMLLTPFTNEINYPAFRIVSSVDIEKSAEKVFDYDLSFVKKSVYSDNEIIYMYGYGDKVLRKNDDGSLEYTAKVSENPQKLKLDFNDGLRESLNQINKMHDLGTSLYLSGYSQIESPNEVETVYSFNYTKDGIPYYIDSTRDGSLIEVKFTNDELVRVRMTPLITYEELDYPQEQSFGQILTVNETMFVRKYEEDRPDTEIQKADYFLMCLQEMTVLETRYTVVDQLLIPTWHIRIAETDYVINLLNRKIMTIDGEVEN
ncbi:hypothetical protein EZV73_04840 [Acidaminobacter sp. JC074]|uniref:hypothetical protein n=1 Tax=Acidaminobacter sp. JC074 TaxID=2530199 RepID=UPI001F0DA0DC|nr:hypothetical protein [Acidaminobacter sp. JC074]MCH4886881.1 hypothetical protein [Acidaminobacter sp. JC074]